MTSSRHQSVKDGEELPTARLATLDGATEPGLDNSYPATPGEFAARWNEWTDEHRAAWLARRIADTDTAQRCFIEGHTTFDRAVEAAAARYHETECVYAHRLVRANDTWNRIDRFGNRLQDRQELDRLLAPGHERERASKDWE